MKDAEKKKQINFFKSATIILRFRSVKLEDENRTKMI